MRNSILPRGNPWLKGLCAVLCCLLFGCCVGFSGLAYQCWYHYGSTGSYEGVAGSPAAENYRQDVLDLFVLKQHKDDLTYLGNQDYKQLRNTLKQANCNFRYRILNMDGKVLMDNLDDEPIENQVSQVYDTVCAINESSYVDFSESSVYVDETGQEVTEGTCSFDQDYIRSKDASYTYVNARDTNEYVLEWGITSPLIATDGLRDWQEHADQYGVLVLPLTLAAVACGLLCLTLFLCLLAATGHRSGTEGIVLSPLHRCPYDLLLVLECGIVGLYLAGCIDLLERFYAPLTDHGGQLLPFFAALSGLSALGGALCLPACTVLTAQLKDHSLGRRTLLCRIFRRLGQLLRQIPTHGRALAIASAFLFLYAFFCFLAGAEASFFCLLLALVMAIAALLVLLWWLRGWQNIRKGGKALAEGDLNYVTDTEHIPWDLRELGEDLNAISKGMQKAVDQRIRSDRFRTELITNVSHDLKTPLTSIINYVDLLKKRNLADETAQSYLEVLDRKSQRLKTLTEDLVEASKASAGVLPVDRQRLEACQLVEQALGEYAEKLTAAQLSVVTRYPKEGAWILADGRHLWRILDNLLSNCAKYAMPGTRVYVDVIRKDGQVILSNKNISADPLNVPADELLQRFVRGDDARSTDGSGLGLSIAQSLANLQGAKFRLQVDGDLFKACVIFPEYH